MFSLARKSRLLKATQPHLISQNLRLPVRLAILIAMEKVYLGLGGNVGDVFQTLKQVEIELIKNPRLHNVTFSPYYVTSPVSDIPQNDFINCASTFQTDLTPFELLEYIQNLEKKLGKVPKAKNMPRSIDIDILFFGQKMVQSEALVIPHPFWRERLFVLVPLSDLTSEVQNFDGERINIKEQIDIVVRDQTQKVELYEHNK